MQLRPFLLCTLIFGALVSMPAGAADFVVIASDVSTIQEGNIIDGEAPLVVPEGKSVTLVAEDGTAVTLKGPFNGVPAPEGGDTSGDRALLTALKGLFGLGSRESSTSIGGVRGAGPARTQPDPWLIDISRSGHQCVLTGGLATLWRADTRETTNVTLRNNRTGAKASTDWPSGAATLDWPTGIALEDGASYMARVQEFLGARKLILHLVPGDLPTDAHRVAWMAERGCTEQARLLLARVK